MVYICLAEEQVESTVLWAPPRETCKKQFAQDGDLTKMLPYSVLAVIGISLICGLCGQQLLSGKRY